MSATPSGPTESNERPSAVASVMDRLPEGMRTDGHGFRSDLAAGFTNAIVGIPSAMGHALLASVNPVSGLLALAVGTPVAALFTSSIYMNISTTSAISVAVGDVMRGVPTSSQAGTLGTLVLLVGIMQVLAGLFRLGSLLRFVSNAVMTGFSTGVAILIILGQLGDATGYSSGLNNKILQVADLLLHLRQIDAVTLVVATLTALLIIGLGYTPLRKFAMIIALAIVTGAVYALMPGSVETVQDVGLIPNRIFQGIDMSYALSPFLATSAAAIVIIGLVQGASVSQSYPNPDGRYPNASRDFLGQGVANAAVSLANGLAVGGSTSGTIVNVAAGARSRWANILAGLFIAPLVFVLGPAIRVVPMASIAALLIVAAAQSIKLSRLHLVWVTGYAPRSAMMLTLVSTLILPLQFAIFVGVAISVFLTIVQQAEKVSVTQLEVPERGMPIEVEAPSSLESNRVTLLMMYGSLSFAAASNLEGQLPSPVGARNAAVVLAMRFNTEVGSTFVTILRRYDVLLRRNQCTLFLAGVRPDVYDQLRRTHVIDQLGADHVIPAESELGKAVNLAIARAEEWIAGESERTAEG